MENYSVLDLIDMGLTFVLLIVMTVVFVHQKNIIKNMERWANIFKMEQLEGYARIVEKKAGKEIEEAKKELDKVTETLNLKEGEQQELLRFATEFTMFSDNRKNLVNVYFPKTGKLIMRKVKMVELFRRKE